MTSSPGILPTGLQAVTDLPPASGRRTGLDSALSEARTVAAQIKRDAVKALRAFRDWLRYDREAARHHVHYARARGTGGKATGE
jgi:hypothetical protein